MGKNLKKLAPILLAMSLLPAPLIADSEINPSDCIPLPADCKKADVAATALYAIGVPDSESYEWGSNAEALYVTEDGVFSLFLGKGTLTGISKDGSGETIKITLSAPDIYFSSKRYRHRFAGRRRFVSSRRRKFRLAFLHRQDAGRPVLYL